MHLGCITGKEGQGGLGGTNQLGTTAANGQPGKQAATTIVN